MVAIAWTRFFIFFFFFFSIPTIRTSWVSAVTRGGNDDEKINDILIGFGRTSSPSIANERTRKRGDVIVEDEGDPGRVRESRMIPDPLRTPSSVSVIAQLTSRSLPVAFRSFHLGPLRRFFHFSRARSSTIARRRIAGRQMRSSRADTLGFIAYRVRSSNRLIIFRWKLYRVACRTLVEQSAR